MAFATADATELGYRWEVIQGRAGDAHAAETIGLLAVTEVDGSFWALAYEYLIASLEEVDAPAAIPAQPAATVPMEAIANGYYTVDLDGSHVTLRVADHWDEKEAGFGVKVVGYLMGQDNEHDYMNFGFLNATGFRMWRKYSPAALARQCAAVEILSGGKRSDYAMAYAMTSGRCARCGRTLTVPASLHRGYGPECAKKS